MYSFEQLKIFVTACDTGSFSAAARKLGRTQSGISQAIAYLEIAVNKTLFHRKSVGLELTDDGQALLPFARGVLQQQQRFDEKVALLDLDQEQQLSLAIDDSLVSRALLQIIYEQTQRFVHTDISVLSVSTAEAIELTASSKTSMGIIYADGDTPEKVYFRTLGYQRMIYVVAPHHPLAGLTQLTLAQLQAHQQLVFRSRERETYWFNPGVADQIFATDSHFSLIQLVLIGAGWAMLPETMAQPYIQAGELVRLDNQFDPHGWLNTVDLIQPKPHQAGPVQLSLITALEHFFQTTLPLQRS